MTRAAADARHNQLVNIARLYYLRNLTHQQIADKLGLSRVKVTRLLQQAVDEGIVQFRIADPAVHTLDLQDELEKRFGLSQALVTPSGSGEAESLDIVARHASSWLEEHLSRNCHVGVGWGRTLNAMASHLGRTALSGVQVVSLTGGLAANASQPNPYDTTTAIASSLGVPPHYLLLPAIVESRATRDLLLREAGARAVTKLWSCLDICLLSIGTVSAETGLFYSFGDPMEAARQVRQAGGVGDLLACPYAENGEFLNTDFAARTITVNSADIRRAKHVVGVACGASKAAAIRGALRTGLLSVLVTDEKAARAVLR